MATAEKKAVRRAQALNRLDDLAVQLGEKLGVEVPDLRLKGGDAGLAQIQQMEATGDLLEAILNAGGEVSPEGEDQSAGDEVGDAADADTPAPKQSAKKPAKQSRRR
jgi:hypothetical protein